MSVTSILVKSWQGFNAGCEFLKPLGDLFIRFWVAIAFFLSGFHKLQSWNTTVLLFQFEYHLPLLSPQTAAAISMFVELGISPLLLIGLGGRIPAFILFIFNLIAMFTYTFLWTPAGYIGLKDHICWGLLLFILVLHGPGKLSLDRLGKNKLYH